jgi:ABC-type sugar transport system ATPase subunit
LLVAKSIFKSFGGVQALRNVDLELIPGEIHGLVGENGAGKSTLMKVLAGAYSPDSGFLSLDGHPLHLRDPKHAQDVGIRIVYQELSLFPALTVAENLYTHRFSDGSLRMVNRRALAAEAKSLIEEWDLGIDPMVRVEQLPMGKRQLVEIAREVARKGRVLILDEPTSSLTHKEIDYLFGVLERLKKSGMCMVFISHRLNEVLRIADRVTVLRNGERVETLPKERLTAQEIITLIVGREIKELYPKKAVSIGEPLLSVRDLMGKGFDGVSFRLHRGEILGFGGLIGAGRSEVLRSLFGLQPLTSGTIELEGAPIRIPDPTAAIRCGFAMLSESRADEGIFPELPVGQNLILMSLNQVSKAGWLGRRAVRDKVTGLVRSLDVLTYNPFHQKLNQLSGGNQQKVVLGRLLGANPRVLLLDEPTRGVDVGTKAEIHRIMGEFVARGNAIIMVSSDIPELIGLSDRILVLHQGRLSGEFRREQFTEEGILQCAMGLPQRTSGT